MAEPEQVTQKMIRCRRFVAESPQVNTRYKGNTPKEELLLEHVREFEEQFVQVYGNRFLFLCPPNEFGVPKFLSTSLRATHLSFKELYEYRSCSQFLADFINYEELNPPNKYPVVIPAPSSVLKWQAGDCFDMSITLCSLLLGVGYDAYCVSGFAPRFITTRNEARSTCPLLEDELSGLGKKGQATDEDEDAKFTIPKKVALKSAYVERIQKEKEEAEAKAMEEETKSDSDDDPSSDEDEFENRRIHCWVMVRKGSREVSEDLYIEPTTGRVYGIHKCPYLKIDLIWNNRNLWVNMQQVAASNVEMELYNSQYFEYVMLDPEAAKESLGSGTYADEEHGDDAGHDETEQRRSETATQFLDMPPSWCERPEITREAFHARCYQGEKTTFYHKVKVEQYAPYSQVDGIVQQIAIYKDVRRQIPIEVREKFQHRRDHLVERYRYPMQNRLVELFEQGRSSALKEFREVSAQRREMIFYNSRLDGLVRSVEEIGHKISEFFEDRDDRLIYHSVTLDPSLAPSGGHKGGGTQQKLPCLSVESMGDLPIRKMTQKYSRNPDVPVDQDYHKVVFLLADQKIRCDFHREQGKITYHSLMFWKEDNNLRLEESTRRGGPVPTAQQVSRLLQMEKNCKMTFMEAMNKTHSELSQRRKEENNIRAWRSIERTEKGDHAAPGARETVLEKSVYDLARERAREDALREGVEEEKEEEQASRVDILAPYLVDFQGKQLDALQAEFVAKKCKNDFRKRLLDRAQIIQKRLEEEQDQLKKRRSQMQRRGDNVEKDERAFEQYQSNAMFRIQILEQRLARHEMQAIKKFSELEKTLAEDPRLAAMWQKGPPAQGGGR